MRGFRPSMTPNFYCVFEQYNVVVSNNSIILNSLLSKLKCEILCQSYV